MALVLAELLDGLVEVAELDDLPDLRLPVVVGEAEVEAEAEVGEVEVGGEVDGDGHHLRAHHWSGGWRLVVGGLRSGGDYCRRRTAAGLYTETEGRGRAPPHKPASTSWTGTRSLTVEQLEQFTLHQTLHFKCKDKCGGRCKGKGGSADMELARGS